MTADGRSAAEWGIQESFKDYRGELRRASSSVIEALLDRLGADAPRPGPAPVRVLEDGRRLRPRKGQMVRLEDGSEVTDDLELPLGYHQLVVESGEEITLIVAPRKCSAARRMWGWAVQLYALRSRASWGIGDLGDLRELGSWSASLGAGIVMINPLHAANPGPHQQTSPYFPGSRVALNPLYLRVGDVPGATDLDLGELLRPAHALNESRRIDRDRVYELKMAALQRLWEEWRGDDSFEEFMTSSADLLIDYAVFTSLAEQYGADWRGWPAAYRSPRGSGIGRWREEHSSRVRFHLWVQWLLERQLEAASGEIDIVHDLAIGVDPSGADAWMWSDVLAQDVRVGAPPDEFNTRGQDWGVLAFDPWKLRAACYEPFVHTLRASLRHAGGIRFDHVMGLFRLYWIPTGFSPEDGAYVRYPHEELLSILALESRRASAFVVGEDLGTVEEVVREEMRARDILSYRLMWFEQDPPASYPKRALAAVTNHDLPTIAGMWTGADLKSQRRMGLEPNEDSERAVRAHLQEVTGLAPSATVEDVVLATYEVLAEAPSDVLTATLEDALAVEERPNQPGTNEPSNWSLALPLPFEQIRDHPGAKGIADVLRR